MTAPRGNAAKPIDAASAEAAAVALHASIAPLLTQTTGGCKTPGVALVFIYVFVARVVGSFAGMTNPHVMIALLERLLLTMRELAAKNPAAKRKPH